MALTKQDLLEIGKIVDQRLNQRLDWNAFKKLIRLEVDEALEEKLEEKFEEKLKYLPTKEEFYKATDRILKELEEMRQEHALTPSHADLVTLEARIEPLERLHPGGKHVTLVAAS